MAQTVESLAKLINELSRLPGIGQRTASRMAYWILEQPEEDVRSLAQSIWQAKKTVKRCPVCQGLTDTEPCAICSDPKRNTAQICVVSTPRDVSAMERTGEYHGLYHVLHGSLSPAANRGPEDLTIRELCTRLEDGSVREVILATNPDLEGEATALYLARLLKPSGVTVTRIANGVPVGSDLEYTDEVTLGRALAGRRQL